MKKTLTALALILAMLLSAFGLAACGKADEGFDFLTENMEDYISIDPSVYQNATLDIELPDVITDKDVAAYITSMLKSYYDQKGETVTLAGEGTIQSGDTVRIWYRGEVNMGDATTEKWVEFIGGCNFYGSTTEAASATDLTIGSGQFIKGFEDALIGLDTADSSLKTVIGTSNNIGTAGLLPIAYVRYNYEYKDANGNKKKGVFFDRIDFTTNPDGSYKEENEGRYTGEAGTALRDALKGKYIKDVVKEQFVFNFDITGDLVAEEVTIKNIEVTHIVKEENALPFVTRDENGAVVSTDPSKSYTFEISFPEKYGNKDLAGKASRWYVYTEQIVRPVGAPAIEKLKYEDVEKILGIKYETITAVLQKYPEEVEAAAGDTGKKQQLVLDHYDEYIKEGLIAQSKSSLEGEVIDALWLYIIKNLEVKQYPEGLIDTYVASLRATAEAEYKEYSASYGSTVYGSMAEFVVNNYSDTYFSTVDKIDEGFRMMAEEQLKQEMAIHHLAKVLGKTMSKKEQEKYYNEQMAAMLSYYNEIYGSQLNGQEITEQDLINQGYTKQAMISEKYYSDVSSYLYETYYKAHFEGLYNAQSAS
ncbi:MAG: hypothetical protein J6V07_01065 [Clostridia bacterium]|nr:hypothetical protein [Clostridia bacterium]